MRKTDELNWDDLKLLLALADGGIVARAAEQLRTDPTTVTRRLKKLEGELGQKLTERIKGGVILTPIALNLIDVARTTEANLNSALSSKETDEVAGVVKVSGTDFAIDLAAPAFAQLCQDHPTLTLELQPTNAYLSLDRRETDIVIRISETPSEGLFGRSVGRLMLSKYASPSLAAKGTGLPWLSWTFPKGLSEIDQAIFEHDSEARIVARIDTAMGQARLASLGCAAAILPDAYVDAHHELSGLVRFGEVGDYGVWVLTHAELRSVPRIKVVMSAIASAFDRITREADLRFDGRA
ncbi:MAG: LysR family transcriptional regulator [Pseudomonadota bacterium]